MPILKVVSFSGAISRAKIADTKLLSKPPLSNEHIGLSDISLFLTAFVNFCLIITRASFSSVTSVVNSLKSLIYFLMTILSNLVTSFILIDAICPDGNC